MAAEGVDQVAVAEDVTNAVRKDTLPENALQVVVAAEVAVAEDVTNAGKRDISLENVLQVVVEEEGVEAVAAEEGAINVEKRVTLPESVPMELVAEEVKKFFSPLSLNVFFHCSVLVFYVDCFYLFTSLQARSADLPSSPAGLLGRFAPSAFSLASLARFALTKIFVSVKRKTREMRAQSAKPEGAKRLSSPAGLA